MTPYPLSWPDHIERRASREKSAFRTTLSGALDNVRKSLEAFGRDSGRKVSGIVISSNATLGVDKPADPGVAVWFTWDGMLVSIPVDRYLSPAENLQAIHHILEARRTELRHGTLALVRASFAGLLSLPSPKGRRSALEVLGLAAGATRDQIEAAYREKAKAAHPDKGGSSEAMAELNQARALALRSAAS